MKLKMKNNETRNNAVVMSFDCIKIVQFSPLMVEI